MTLTRPGLPRPRTADGRFPVPWVAVAENLAVKDEARQRRIATGKVCQVCGLRLDDRAVLFAMGPWPFPTDAVPEGEGVHAMDHGLLHEPCARLALAHCPELRRLRGSNELVMCRVPSGRIEAFGADVERLRL